MLLVSDEGLLHACISSIVYKLASIPLRVDGNENEQQVNLQCIFACSISIILQCERARGNTGYCVCPSVQQRLM